MKIIGIGSLVLLGMVGGTGSALAQQSPAVPQDSVLAQLRRLQQRLDSLERVIDELRAAQAPDTAEAVDELAALRAAAAAAAPPADTTTEPEQVQFVGRTRNLNRANPEISATGDVRLLAVRPGPQRDNVDVREFEFAFQSALDPYTNTKIFFTFEDGEASIEEAYAYRSGLPGGFRVDAGRQRQQIGELNRIHLHALPESEYPLVLQTYLGEEGLIGDGVSIYWLAPIANPTLGTHELWAQVTLGNNEVLFEDGNRLSILGHLNNFWQLSRSTFAQVGFTGVYGENPDENIKTRLFGADFRITWRPPAQGTYRSFTLRGEGYTVRKQIGGLGDSRFGGYLGVQYQMGRRTYLGTRFDYVEPLAGPDDADWAVVPSLTFWQSEWVYYRAEWQHLSTPITGIRETSDRFVLQIVWAFGPHKHETY